MATETRELRALRAKIKACGSISAAAREMGCSRQLIHDMLHEKRDVSVKTLAKLGLRRVVVAARPEVSE